jgi:hypothetical protein
MSQKQVSSDEIMFIIKDNTSHLQVSYKYTEHPTLLLCKVGGLPFAFAKLCLLTKTVTPDELMLCSKMNRVYVKLIKSISQTESRMTDSVRSVERALDILLCFSLEKPSFSLTQIAEQVGSIRALPIGFKYTGEAFRHPR